MNTQFAQSHKLINNFPTARDIVVRVTLKHGHVYKMRSCFPVDETVYNEKGLWCGEIVEVLKVPAEKAKLFHAGIGIDFLEEDIAEIYDEASQQVLFKR